MKKINLAFCLIYVCVLLCGCTEKEQSSIDKQIEEVQTNMRANLEKDRFVTLCDCPNVYVNPKSWDVTLYQAKESIGRAYYARCKKTVVFRDSLNNSVLLKCNDKKCF